MGSLIRWRLWRLPTPPPPPKTPPPPHLNTLHPHLNTPHPHLNTTVGTDKDTRFNMVEVMGPDIQLSLSLNLTEEVMGPDTKLSLNLTEEVTKLPPMEDIRPQVTEATNKEVMEVRIRRWEPDL